MSPDERVCRERLVLSAVLAGDEQAWRAWYDESFLGLYSYVFWRAGGRRDFAEEIVQETWLTAVKRIHAFLPEQGSFAQWLCGIAANLVRNQLRQDQRRARRTVVGNGYMSPGRDASREVEQTRAEDIAAALCNLPERYERVLRAKYLDEQSVAQISDEWNETPKAIESLLSRARQALRDALQNEE